MAAADLSVAGLTAGYGPTVILENVSFEARRGECLAVVGRNGMGKTTLLASIMGLTRRVAGEIRLGDARVELEPPPIRARRGLGYVPQTRDVFPTLTVEENLFVGLKGRPRGALDEAYALFPRLAERRQNLGGQLSGGEQQMLSTARTLLGKPAVLLLDEPLEGLAPVVCQELMAALSRLVRDREMTVVIVEQHLESLRAIAERVIVLERGRIAWTGEIDAFSADAGLVDRYLGVAGLH